MTANVAKKIALVMADIGKIEKVRSGGVNYAFQAWDDIRAELRSACIAHGLVIIPHVTSHSYERIEQDGKTAQYQHVAGMRFEIVDVDTGDSHIAEWFGEARDTSDKGLQKAGTSGMKYWLLKTFQIADRDASEQDEQPAPEIVGRAVQVPNADERVKKHLARLIPANSDSDADKKAVAEPRRKMWDRFCKAYGQAAVQVLLGCDDLQMAENALKEKEAA